VAVFPFSPAGEWDLWSARRLTRFMAVRGMPILHAHTAHAWGLGALALWGTPRKLVVTRRVDFPLGRSWFSRWKRSRAGAVAAISGEVRRVLLAGGLPPETVTVIPSGIDPAGYPATSDRERLRRERNIPQDVPVVVHVGALVPHKDQHALVRAAGWVARDLPSVLFYVAGEGEERPALESLIRERGLGKTVTLLGQREDALEYTALADVFVLPSREEGLGTALLDALVLGVPTAATRAGGIPDLYGDPASPELTPVGDDRALAENIVKVLRDPAEARRRVERGRERARHFTVSAMADRYEEMYRRLL
jgi:glycosyltransferase involved in cell wall biosynthesis